MGANVTNYDALLKEVWPQEDIYDLLYDQAPHLAALPKDTNFEEKVRHVAVGYGFAQNLGATVAEVESIGDAVKQAEFQVTKVSMFGAFEIDRILIKQSKGKRGAIMAALSRETEFALKAYKKDLAKYLTGNGGGALFQASNVSGQTITVSDPNLLVHIDKGMRLQSSSTDGTSGSVNTGYVTVASVDPDAGTITVVEASVATGIPSVGTTDYFFRKSMFGAAVKGCEAWVPSSVSATAFFGLDRTVSPRKLGGVRVTATGLSPREASMKAAKELRIMGAKPSHEWLHPDDYLKLQNDLASAGLLVNTKEPGAAIGKYTFGTPFEGIGFVGPSGVVKCMSDYNFVAGVSHMQQIDTWKLASLGPLCYIDDTDGNRMTRILGADSYRGRVVGDFQLICEAPGFNARVAR